MDYIYEEKQPMVRIFMIINVVVIVVLLWVIYSSYQSGDLPFIAIAINGFVIVLLLFIMINFSALKIRLTSEQLHFSFGMFKKKIYIKNMGNLKVTDYKFHRFGGFGVRKSFTGITGFIARPGKGIEFLETHLNKKIYLSTDNPDELFALLQQYGAKI